MRSYDNDAICNRKRATALLCGASALAMFAAAPAWAQDGKPGDTGDTVEEATAATPEAPAPTADTDVIVVTGIRAALETSQSIKRDADTFVDSITAEDIGALPDRSVLEAIQRVPGVSISRFEAADDPDHFSVEGSGVVIRGLTFVRSEFNGRDTFSANNGRALNFNDIPPELVGGVDVFKNQTADMIEGGIAGVVNLRTLLPFDRREQTIALSAEANWGDLAREFSPTISGVYSNRWDTDAGEFGLVVSANYSQQKSQSNGFQLGPLYPKNAGFTGAASSDDDDDNGSLNIAAPTSANVRQQDFNRERYGVAVAAQWASPDDSMLATAQFIRSEASNAWTEHTIQAEEDPPYRANDLFALGEFGTTPLDGPVFATRDDLTPIPVGALFSNGVISSANDGWHGRNGVRLTNFVRHSDTDTQTTDAAFNFKYTPTDRLKFNFDAQYIDSTTKAQDLTAHGVTHGNIALDLRGDEPSVGYQVSEADGNLFDSFTDPVSTYYRSAMDHFEDSEGEEWAFRGDVEYEFDEDNWFKSIRAGGRYADRDQTTRWSEYNWGNISEAWNGPGDAGQNIVDFSDGPADAFETFDFGSNFHRGGILQGNSQFLFIDDRIVKDRQLHSDFYNNDELFPNRQWQSRVARGEGNLFDFSEISDTSETTYAGYVRVDFGRDTGSFPKIDGNIGLRFVRTELRADGFNALDQIDGEVADLVAADDPALFAFFNTSAATPRSADRSDTQLLPSFNARIELDEGLYVRFAASKTISRPETGNLRAYRQLSANVSGIDDPDNPMGPPIDYTTDFRAQGGNPDLDPIESLNLDASVEYYFDNVGRVTFSAFYKALDNIIVSGTELTEAVEIAPGRDLQFNYFGAVNGGRGEIKGFEVAYADVFEFLPGPLGNLGMEANYTFVDQSRIPNGGLRPVGAIGVNVVDRSGQFNVGRLEGLSKHTVNVVGFYQDDLVEARVAYNWRSSYLLATTDVITTLPIVHESTGQLDATLKLNLTDWLQIYAEGQNLLSETVETSQIYNSNNDRILRSLFENDRTFTGGVRLTF
ncbi:MAG: TonB-dependent receptor [Pacificimonas sp.]